MTVTQFDNQFYLSQRPDVGVAIANGIFPWPVENHYNVYGWRELSDPNPQFDTSYYLAANPDILAARTNPFQHFVNHGISEGRMASGAGQTSSGSAGQFDPLFYFSQRPDVLAAIAQGRFAGTAEDHYNQYGWREGSDPNAHFDTSYYLEANPDVAAAQINPFQHFVNHGISQGRTGREVVEPSQDVVQPPQDVVQPPQDVVQPPQDVVQPPQNQAPTAVTLNPVLTELAENADTTASIKIADIVVTDADGIGTNTLSLSGANADLFSIVDGVGGKELHLNAGTVLDYETLPSLAVSVAVDDASVGATPDASTDFALPITDVQEIITVDGSLADWEWGGAAPLVAPAPTPAGYAVYGSYQDSAFIIALQAPEGVTIGANTTLWFNTDLNNATGQDIFLGAPPDGGAEYNINFDSVSGVPALYTGDAGATLVPGAPPLDYAISAAGNVLEIALPSALVGGATSAELFVDVNNSVFLPTFFSAGGYMLDDVSIFV